jgi:hypothetical protein
MFYCLILILCPTCYFSSTTITTTTCFVSTSSLANNPMTLVFHPIDFKYGLQLVEQILLCLGRNQLVILGTPSIWDCVEPRFSLKAQMASSNILWTECSCHLLFHIGLLPNVVANYHCSYYLKVHVHGSTHTTTSITTRTPSNSHKHCRFKEAKERIQKETSLAYKL